MVNVKYFYLGNNRLQTVHFYIPIPRDLFHGLMVIRFYKPVFTISRILLQ
jgi:hypothetical protein